MPSTILTRLGSGLRAVNRIRLDGARVALGASVLGALSAIVTTRLLDQSGTLAWFVDLATHWQWLYVIVGIVSGVMLLRRGMLPVIPIDHVLTSTEWQVVKSGMGPNVGSDHRPVFVVLRIHGS